MPTQTMGQRLKSANVALTAAATTEANVCKAVLSWQPLGRKATAARAVLQQAQVQSRTADQVFAGVVNEIAILDGTLGADLKNIGPRRVLAEVDGDSPLLARVRSVAAEACKCQKAKSEAEAASSAAQSASTGGWRAVLLALDALPTTAYESTLRLFEAAGGGVAPPRNPDALADAVSARLKALG